MNDATGVLLLLLVGRDARADRSSVFISPFGFNLLIERSAKQCVRPAQFNGQVRDARHDLQVTRAIYAEQIASSSCSTGGRSTGWHSCLAKQLFYQGNGESCCSKGIDKETLRTTGDLCRDAVRSVRIKNTLSSDNFGFASVRLNRLPRR